MKLDVVWEHTNPHFYFQYRSVTKTFYRKSLGVILVYDISNRRSFEHLEEWLEEAKMNIEPQKAIYMLVGHKVSNLCLCDINHFVY